MEFCNCLTDEERSWLIYLGCFKQIHSLCSFLLLLAVPRRYFFCGSFMGVFLSCVCLVFAMPLCASVYMCTCWERADLLALVCGV